MEQLTKEQAAVLLAIAPEAIGAAIESVAEAQEITDTKAFASELMDALAAVAAEDEADAGEDDPEAAA